MARVPLFRVKDLSFTPFLFLAHLNLDVNVRYLETLPEHCAYVWTIVNLFDVTIRCSQLPVIFDSCQLRGLKIGIPAFPPKKTKQKKPEKVDFFFTLKKKAKSWKNSRNFSFQLFCDSWDINITQENCFTLYRIQILKISRFSWEKGALSSSFHNGDWKWKEGFLFSVLSTEYK